MSRSGLQPGHFGRRSGRLLLLLALALIVWSLLAWAAARFLILEAPLDSADALAVLSGSANYAERTRLAARLFREGRAPKVLLTDDGQRGGWSSAERRNPFFVERARAELIKAGVPAENIEVLPQQVSSTYDEAALLRRHAAAHDIRSILVVTSAYHSRRSLWTLRRVFRGGPVEVGLAAVGPGQQTPRPAEWWWRPAGWRAVAGEYFKLVYYRLRYG